MLTESYAAITDRDAQDQPVRTTSHTLTPALPANYSFYFPTAFFLPDYSNGICAYDVVVEDAVDDPEFFRNLRNSANKGTDDLGYGGDPVVLSISRALLRSVSGRDDVGDGSPEGALSMDGLIARGEEFVCMHCPMENRQARSWVDLVSI